MSCSFIPPHLFTELLEKGDEEQKAMAQEALGFIRSFASFAKENVLPSSIEEFFGSKKNGERFVYDAQNKSDRSGVLVRGENDKSKGDKAVDEAWEGAGWTRKFFKEIFDRNSIDDRGMPLKNTVHFGNKYPNAYWSGTAMFYGDGDGRIFNRFTAAIDVIGHEIGHGITERSAGLVYYKQPGALNEHFSDVFGSMVKQYSKNQKAVDADWIIGEGLFTSRVSGDGIRNMLMPGTAYDCPLLGKDPQPDHFSKYRDISEDSGGVHIFSGIPNRAFANACLNLGGYSWDVCGKVWYKALTTKIGKKTNFQEAANIIASVAGEMYGKNSIEQKAIANGFELVGLKPKV